MVGTTRAVLLSARRALSGRPAGATLEHPRARACGEEAWRKQGASSTRRLFILDEHAPPVGDCARRRIQHDTLRAGQACQARPPPPCTSSRPNRLPCCSRRLAHGRRSRLLVLLRPAPPAPPGLSKHELHHGLLRAATPLDGPSGAPCRPPPRRSRGERLRGAACAACRCDRIPPGPRVWAPASLSWWSRSLSAGTGCLMSSSSSARRPPLAAWASIDLLTDSLEGIARRPSSRVAPTKRATEPVGGRRAIHCGSSSIVVVAAPVTQPHLQQEADGIPTRPAPRLTTSILARRGSGARSLSTCTVSLRG